MDGQTEERTINRIAEAVYMAFNETCLVPDKDKIMPAYWRVVFYIMNELPENEQYAEIFLKRMKKKRDTHLLQPIHSTSVDIQNNDDLFNLILEQRDKINEIIEKNNT